MKGKQTTHANTSAKEDRIKNLCGAIGCRDFFVDMGEPLWELRADSTEVDCPECSRILKEHISNREQLDSGGLSNE